MRISHRLKLFTAFALIIGTSAILSLVLARKTYALSGSEFQPGRIIDDSVFFNSNSMSEGQIQEFLNAKVLACDTNGTKPYAGTTRAAYGASKGTPPPYICLKDYSQMTTTKNPEDMLCNGHTAGQKTAARIIKEVADSCGVSPKVLLILLQKEQSLVTDDWPWPIQYRSATGYGCPDTAPCDTQYYGFFNQVYNAARIYKYYAKYPNSFNHLAGRNNNILYHPNSGCGRSTVYIQNQATAGLYNYTPYQPNSAALNNLYSTGDGCSSYGNRNFWRMFNDWFGTILSDRPTSNVNWKFENLDGGANGLNPSSATTGLYPQTIRYNEDLYILYYEASGGDLRMAKADSTGWSYQTLDGNSTTAGRINADVGKSSVSLIYNDALHLFYYDTTNRTLRHAWYNPIDGWVFEVLDGTADSASPNVANVGMSNAAVVYGNDMHIFYYDATNTNLRHAKYTPNNGWKFQNLEGDIGSISGFNSNVGQNPKAGVYGGSLQLFYYDVSNGNLRHAWVASPTSPWKFENLEGDIGSISGFNSNVGQDPALAVHGGSLQLFYYDVSNGNLRHAWVASPTSPWKFENLEGDIGSISGFNSNVGSMGQAVSFKNILYVFYRDHSGGLARYGWADPGGWHFASLEGASYSVSGHKSNTGFWPTATGYGSSLQLYYFDNDQRALRHAFGVPYW